MSCPPYDWTLDDLDAAYLDGHRAGLAGQRAIPPPDAILALSWEAGWEDGAEQLRCRLVRSDTPFVWDHFPPLLSVRIHNSSARPPLGKSDFGLRMQVMPQPVRLGHDKDPTPRGTSLLSVQIVNSTARPPLSAPDFGLRMQRLVLVPRRS